MIYNFPRTKFVDINGIVGQVLHMSTEQEEIERAILEPDIDHVAEEVMDKLHSCETALRILSEFHGIDPIELRRHVERKNFARGYYQERREGVTADIELNGGK